MRHKVVGKKLSRHVGARTALRKVMVKQLFEYERIRTTRAKAQAIRGQAERLITLAKRALATGDNEKIVHARRLVHARLADNESVKKLFDEIAPRYEERNGGYTRLMKLGRREGDSSEMVVLELVE